MRPETLNRALLTGPERFMNRTIRESTAARDLLASMAGSVLAIEIRGLGITLGVVADRDRIELTTVLPRPANVTVRGTPLDLMRLGGADPSAALHTSRSEVTGELELAQKFADLFRLARPDPEHEAARLVGDVAANELALMLGAAGRWLGGTFEALERSFAEYLKEESRALPERAEVEGFANEVDALRDDVERLAQRIERSARPSARRR